MTLEFMEFIVVPETKTGMFETGVQAICVNRYVGYKGYAVHSGLGG